MKKEKADNLIELTRNGYDRSARDWAGTRMNFWKELNEKIFPFIKKSKNLLDLGCGNARFYREIKDLNLKYSGLDISEGLIKEAQKYHPDLNLLCASAINTPYENNSFDCIVSFAVLHHIPSHEYREKFFKESYRLLEKDGFLILTVWNIWKTKKTQINNFFKENTDADLGDLIMDFSQHKKMRYVYGFKKEELEALAKKTGFSNTKIETVARKSKKGDEENFLLIAQK